VRIVLSSYFAPVSVGNYLRRAALRLGHDVVCFGSTTEDVQPWPDAEIRAPGVGVPASAIVVDPLEAARGADVWIDVDGWSYYPGDVPIPRALIATDPHLVHYWDETVPQTDYARYEPQRELMKRTGGKFFTMQLAYRRAGDEFVPYGFDREWCFPPEREPTSYEYDVTILGAPYHERVLIAEHLREWGFHVRGPGREGIGLDYRAALCSAPVAIVWPLGDDIPARLNEATACGRFVIMKDTVLLRRAPVQIVGCMELAKDEQEVRMILSAAVESGYRLKPHSIARDAQIATWENRLAQILRRTIGRSA